MHLNRYSKITKERASLKEAIFSQMISFVLFFDLVVSFMYPQGVPHLSNKFSKIFHKKFMAKL